MAVIGPSLTGGRYTIDQILALAYVVGWRYNTQITAVAIAIAESGLSPTATGHNGPTSGCPNGSDDRGLWQINDCYHPDVTDTCAYEALCNAKAAYSISTHGTSFRPWSTYNSGAYKSNLTAVQTRYNNGTWKSWTKAWSGGNVNVPNPQGAPPWAWGKKVHNAGERLSGHGKKTRRALHALLDLRRS